MTQTITRRDGVAEGLAYKRPVKCATTANITLSAEQTIDGVVTNGDRVLVMNQTDTTQNGIYVSGTGAWVRSLDFDGSTDFVTGTRVYVTNGTANGNQTFTCTVSADPPVIGTSTITFSGSATLANSSVTNAKLANAAAYSLKGNFTGASAAPQDSTIGSLTQKVSPAGTDLLLIQDQAASGQLKYATISSVGGGVTSVGGLTGAVTLTAADLATSGQNIQLSAGRKTRPTTQSLTTGSSATYTTPANCLTIEVFMVGGGGGGAGALSGNSTNFAVAGSIGTKSTFNSIDAAPGGGAPGATGTAIAAGGAGGTGGAGVATRRQPGCAGSSATAASNTTLAGASGAGGAAYFGGGGINVVATSAGTAAAANTGAGGGGALNNSGANFNCAGGGGGGEFVYLLINSPAATYTYTVGTGGAGGTSTSNGGAGGSGFIFVIEYYN